MPESIASKSLDPGIRRDDEKRINQKFLELPLIVALADRSTTARLSLAPGTRSAERGLLEHGPPPGRPAVGVGRNLQ